MVLIKFKLILSLAKHFSFLNFLKTIKIYRNLQFKSRLTENNYVDNSHIGCEKLGGVYGSTYPLSISRSYHIPMEK